MRSLYMFLASMGIVLAASAAHNPKWVRFSQPSNYANFDVTEVAVKVDTFGNVYTAASILDTVNSLSNAMI
ncbi:MAG: hypothetical protein JWO06_1097, partial [Bacteroidota bacterium]|nr:hypothetical protein [Bacteroidota bacterium]